MRKLVFFAAMLFFRIVVAQAQQTAYPDQTEGAYLVPHFKFSTGEEMEPLKLHYITIGKPLTGNDGKVKNAVLIMHGTTGDGKGFLNKRFAGNLFGPGQLLDAKKYFIILPDAIGHGQSSKPSDSLHMRFPKYTYDDMVLAQYRLLTEHLGVNHLRLVMGTSMGAMHTWVWGYTYPDFMDALVPLASYPAEIAGRNRMIRKMAVNLIENDPEWKGGEYTAQPKEGISGAVLAIMFMVSSPLQYQKQAPTRVQAETFVDRMVKNYSRTWDANDVIYAYESSRDYNPSLHTEKITAPLLAINSADDQVNPPELRFLMDNEIKKMKNGKFILIPTSDRTSGHGTHSDPTIWGDYLEEFLRVSEK